MYHPDVANRAKMTKGQQAVEDTKIVGKKVGKVLKYGWMILTLIVMSFWLVALMVWIMGMLVD
jgi:hypothetical protein